jgi:hypothetical protein
MKKNILIYTLFGFSIILAFFSWKSTADAISQDGSNEWVAPVIFFSLFFVCFYLSLALIRNLLTLNILVAICLFSSFFFVFEKWHLLLILAGFLLTVSGAYRIHRDMNLNIKINLAKTLTTGKHLILIGFALVLSGQYFFIVKNQDFEKIIPQFINSKYSDIFISKIISILNPEYQKISQEEITVDQFIIQTQQSKAQEAKSELISEDQIKESIEKMGTNFSSSAKNEIKENLKNNLESVNNKLLENNEKMILEESRKKMEQMVGRELSGNEKISEIFNDIINKKIVDYFRPEIKSEHGVSLLPLILSIMLFLTIVPFGSVINILWIISVKIIFWIIVKTRIITITRNIVEVERIE